jgi:hypothetical protein
MTLPKDKVFLITFYTSVQIWKKKFELEKYLFQGYKQSFMNQFPDLQFSEFA